MGRKYRGPYRARWPLDLHSGPYSLHYPEREGALLGYPPRAISSTSIPVPTRTLRVGMSGWLRVWSGRSFNMWPTPYPAASGPHLPTPAQVTGGRYTTRILEFTELDAMWMHCCMRPKRMGFISTNEWGDPIWRVYNETGLGSRNELGGEVQNSRKITEGLKGNIWNIPWINSERRPEDRNM